jgi:hypothetical protein
MSRGMVTRRQGRISALTAAEMRSALTFLSGWTPTGTDCALGDADALRACRECREDPPGHTAFTLIDRHQESAWRHEAGQATPERGRHRAPKPQTIPRAPTEHAPPWEGEHVIEPAAIMPAPVPDPGPDAFIIAAGTVDADGRLTSASIAVLPPLPAPVTVPARPSYWTDEIGDRSADAWLESAFTKAHARLVAALDAAETGAP